MVCEINTVMYQPTGATGATKTTAVLSTSYSQWLHASMIP